MTSAGLKKFQSLNEEFDLPNNMLFRYLLLCHAFMAQFGSNGPKLVEFSTPVYVMEGHPKGIISMLYHSFLTHWRGSRA